MNPEHYAAASLQHVGGRKNQTIIMNPEHYAACNTRRYIYTYIHIYTTYILARVAACILLRIHVNVAVTTTIRLRFDGRSTAVPRR